MKLILRFQTNDTRTSFTDNDTFIVPRLFQMLHSHVEFPYEQSNVRVEYDLTMNLVTEPNRGLNTIQGHINRIREIFELKKINLSGADVLFETVRTQAGFLVESGDSFEVPVGVFFSTILNRT